MMDNIFIWTRVLFICCCFLAVHCVQPNCTSVADFDNCLGNVTGFCPKDIACACKDGEPFCNCPNFRGQWGNYWYMGAKCDQLWNTLDLVLVAVLPGIGLALIVGVTIQTIHYCKKKSKNNVNDQRQQRSSSGLQPEHNSAFAFDNAVRFSQPHEGQVNTKTHLSNRLSVRKTPKTEMLCKNKKKLGRSKKYSQVAECSIIRRSNCTNEEWAMTGYLPGECRPGPGQITMGVLSTCLSIICFQANIT